jgi:hypothetical protein
MDTLPNWLEAAVAAAGMTAYADDWDRDVIAAAHAPKDSGLLLDPPGTFH